jgi:hypothetical protein
MSGRRIDDHSFWAGSKSKGSVFPEGVKVKEESSASGYASEAMKDYPDTSEAVKRNQEIGISKMKGHQLKTGYRH